MSPLHASPPVDTAGATAPPHPPCVEIAEIHTTRNTRRVATSATRPSNSSPLDARSTIRSPGPSEMLVHPGPPLPIAPDATTDTSLAIAHECFISDVRSTLQLRCTSLSHRQDCVGRKSPSSARTPPCSRRTTDTVDRVSFDRHTRHAVTPTRCFVGRGRLWCGIPSGTLAVGCASVADIAPP